MMRLRSFFEPPPCTFVNWDEEPNLAALGTAKSQLDAGSPSGMRALEWLSEQGSIAAMLYIADHWWSAEPSEPEKARAWYARAAERGNTRARHDLGAVLQQLGRYSEALELFETNTRIDFAPSIYRLGLMYKSGRGVLKDLHEAERLLLLASNTGHVFAKAHLSQIYLQSHSGLANKLRGIALRASAILFVLTFVLKPTEHFYSDDRLVR